MKKNSNLLYFFFVLLFGAIGIYCIFFLGGTSGFDSKTKAYKIDPNPYSDTDGTITYYPIYYFKVDDKEYECKVKNSTSAKPRESKNTVYYDSANPEKCKTEYEESTGLVAGILCLAVSVLAVVMFIFKKKKSNNELLYEDHPEKQYQAEQKVEQIGRVVGKAQLIYKRIIIGIVLAILFIFIIVDILLLRQTIVSKDYPEATAVFVERKDGDSTIFDDCIYSFPDKEGKKQEIIVSVPEDEDPEPEIKIKYNEKNPQDFYEEGATMNTPGIILFILKVIIFNLLLVVFFNANLLNKIHIFSR